MTGNPCAIITIGTGQHCGCRYCSARAPDHQHPGIPAQFLLHLTGMANTTLLCPPWAQQCHSLVFQCQFTQNKSFSKMNLQKTLHTPSLWASYVVSGVNISQWNHHGTWQDMAVTVKIQVRYLMRGINGEKLGLKCLNVGNILTI